MLSKVSTIAIQILGFFFFLMIKQKNLSQLSYLEWNIFHVSKDTASWEQTFIATLWYLSISVCNSNALWTANTENTVKICFQVWHPIDHFL